MLLLEQTSEERLSLKVLDGFGGTAERGIDGYLARYARACCSQACALKRRQPCPQRRNVEQLPIAKALDQQ
jgi:hypothetical protein